MRRQWALLAILPAAVCRVDSPFLQLGGRWNGFIESMNPQRPRAKSADAFTMGDSIVNAPHHARVKKASDRAERYSSPSRRSKDGKGKALTHSQSPTRVGRGTSSKGQTHPAPHVKKRSSQSPPMRKIDNRPPHAGSRKGKSRPVGKDSTPRGRSPPRKPSTSPPRSPSSRNK